MINFSWWLKDNLYQYSSDESAHFEGLYLDEWKRKRKNKK